MELDNFLAEYAKEFAFETWFIATEENGTKTPYKAIAINLGHTSSQVFDSVWRRKCACSAPFQPGEELAAQRCCGPKHCRKCNGTGYIEPYDLMTPFVRRSDKLWNVSLYSTKPEIDCGEIARFFWGSGTKKQAEFRCKELPFEY